MDDVTLASVLPGQSPELMKKIKALDHDFQIHLVNAWNLKGRPPITDDFIRDTRTTYDINRSKPVSITLTSHQSLDIRSDYSRGH